MEMYFHPNSREPYFLYKFLMLGPLGNAVACCLAFNASFFFFSLLFHWKPSPSQLTAESYSKPGQKENVSVIEQQGQRENEASWWKSAISASQLRWGDTLAPSPTHLPLLWMWPEMLSSPPAAGLLARRSSFGHRQPALSSEGCCLCMSSAEVPLWLSYRFCLSSWACRLLAGRLASFLPSLLIPQPLHDCCLLRWWTLLVRATCSPMRKYLTSSNIFHSLTAAPSTASQGSASGKLRGGEAR